MRSFTRHNFLVRLCDSGAIALLILLASSLAQLRSVTMATFPHLKHQDALRSSDNSVSALLMSVYSGQPRGSLITPCVKHASLSNGSL